MNDAKIAAFVKERNEMLLRGDVDEAIAFQKKYNPDVTVSREIAEIGMHKARTAVEALPLAERVLSYRWLTSRGYKSMDDGDLCRYLDN